MRTIAALVVLASLLPSPHAQGPLVVHASRCLDPTPSGLCTPGLGFGVVFSHDIDESSLANRIRISPDPGPFGIGVRGSLVELRWDAKPRERYTITLLPGIRDVAGRTLGSETRVTMETAGRRPQVHIPGRREMVVWDPAAAPRFPVYSVNYSSLTVTARAVEPEEWKQFAEHRNEFNDLSRTLPGRVVFTREYRVTAAADETAETLIDLTPALQDGVGHVVLTIAPPVPRANVGWDRFPVWIQVTRLAVDATVALPRIQAWVTSLDSGRPIADATVKAIPGGTPTVTGADGVASVDQPPHYPWAVVARAGSDSAFTTHDFGFWVWFPHGEEYRTRFYIFDTRGLFRPGEEVPIKGWMRRIAKSPRSTLLPFDEGIKKIDYSLVDSTDKLIASGSARVSSSGAFDFVVGVPRKAAPGKAKITFYSDEAKVPTFHTHEVEIQDFETPPFEVTVAPAQAAPYFARTGAPVTLTAASFSGTPIANAAVTWRVTATPARYSPPNHEQFVFGLWPPSTMPEPPPVRTFEERTDAAGHVQSRLNGDERKASAVALEAHATVRDAKGQSAATAVPLTALIHPAELYAGLRPERWFVAIGEPIRVEAIATTVDGNVVAGKSIELRAERLQYTAIGKPPRVAKTERCSITSADKPGACTFATANGGTYRITASIADAHGRTSETEIEVAAWGEINYWSDERPANEVVHERLTVVADKREYRAGDVAELLVHAPFAPAEGLLTIRRRGLLHTQRFTLSKPSGTVRVALDRNWIPSVIAQIDLVGSAPRTKRGSGTGRTRPAFASGTTRLFLPPVHAALSLELTHDTRVTAGRALPVAITVRDASGAPAAGAELTVAVVDEAVLFQTQYALPDPLTGFYRHAARGGDDAHFRRDVLLWRFDDPVPDIPRPRWPQPLVLDDEFYDEWDEPMAVSFNERGASLETEQSRRGQPRTIRLRRDVNSIIAYAASVITDPQGRATVEVKLPGNPSRYRLMVVAARELEFGRNESVLTSERRR